jgi:hypothetical protein
MIEGFLIRDDETTVDGCNGVVTSYKDYCYNPPLKTLVRMGRDKEPPESYPLEMCQGGKFLLRTVKRDNLSGGVKMSSVEGRANRTVSIPC